MGVATMPRNSVSLLTSEDNWDANLILRDPGIDFHLPDGLVDVDVCCSLDIDNVGAPGGGCLNFSKKDENVLDR